PLKTAARPIGALPGEGAAFFLVETRDKAARRGAEIHGSIESLVLTKEPVERFSAEPPLGKALSAAILQTLEGLPGSGAEVGLLIGNLNGDEWRAREWG